MRKTISAIILLLPCLYVNGAVTIRDLDEALKCKDYQIEKEKAIAIKKAEAAEVAVSDRELYFWKLSEIRDEYASFQIDSAMAYSLRSIKVAKEINRPDYLTIAQMHAVEELTNQGQYLEARDLLATVKREDVPEYQIESYYYKYNALYEALGDYSENLDTKYYYREKEYAYKDSIRMVSPDNVFIQSALLVASNQDEKALELLMKRFNSYSEDDRDIGPVAYAISKYYRRNGIRQEEKKYLIISAISDAKCSVKEYLSLRRLSEILYDEGDYTRAHKYIVRCLDDAMFSGARLRMVQVSSVLPLLETAYQQKLAKRFLAISISCIVILALLVVLSILLRQRRMQQFKLDKANKLLSESGAIKNIYIFNLLMECVSRIDTLDRYRRMLKRKAMGGDKASVLDELKSTSLIDEQWQSFYQNFDKTILEIFPSFIDGVNELMSPGYEFEKGLILTVELRILALIRLGIDETERIASILNYSKATIYSYRSRIRLRSKDPKLFEQKLLEISSI